MPKIDFEPGQLLAILPSAIGREAPRAASAFDLPAKKLATIDLSGVLGADIGVPYSSILDTARAAIDAGADTILLNIDSPGGLVAGAFDTARELRALFDSAGVRAVGFVGNQAVSAGYAILSACHEIIVSSTANVGHIGVIAKYGSQFGALEKSGIAITVLTSGTHKADGDPDTVMTDSARAALQIMVDDSAEVFFALVRDLRGIDAKPLEAQRYVGARAVAMGLADRVASLTEITRALSEPPVFEDKMDEKEKTDDVRAALFAAAEDGDEKAARALAAYDGENTPEEEEKKKEDGEEKAECPPSEDGEEKAECPPSDDEDKKDETKALSAMARDLAAMRAELDCRNAADEKLERRAALNAKRVEGNFRAVLEEMPIKQFRKIIAAIPDAAKPSVAELDRIPTASGFGGMHAVSEEMRAKMGLNQNVRSIVREPGRIQLGVMLPKVSK